MQDCVRFYSVINGKKNGSFSLIERMSLISLTMHLYACIIPQFHVTTLNFCKSGSNFETRAMARSMKVKYLYHWSTTTDNNRNSIHRDPTTLCLTDETRSLARRAT
jgi:hypothetical protein